MRIKTIAISLSISLSSQLCFAAFEHNTQESAAHEQNEAYFLRKKAEKEILERGTGVIKDHDGGTELEKAARSLAKGFYRARPVQSEALAAVLSRNPLKEAAWLWRMDQLSEQKTPEQMAYLIASRLNTVDASKIGRVAHAFSGDQSFSGKAVRKSLGVMKSPYDNKFFMSDDKYTRAFADEWKLQLDRKQADAMRMKNVENMRNASRGRSIVRAGMGGGSENLLRNLNSK